VDWQGVTPADYENVMIRDDGLPESDVFPELTERAEALVEAAHHRCITGIVNDEDGFTLRPIYMRLDRDSVAKWIAETEARLEKQPATHMPATAPLDCTDKLITAREAAELLDMPVPTFNRLQREGKAPAPAETEPQNKWWHSVITKYGIACSVKKQEVEDTRKVKAERVRLERARKAREARAKAKAIAQA
jgi:hypothetical protein